MRHIPIFTFINKMDRDANDTFELLDDIEKELGIETCPINWPIGSGKDFKGVYDRNTKKVMTFSDTLKGTKEGEQKEIDIDDPALKEELGEDYWSQLMDEIELLEQVRNLIRTWFQKESCHPFSLVPRWQTLVWRHFYSTF